MSTLRTLLDGLRNTPEEDDLSIPLTVEELQPEAPVEPIRPSHPAPLIGPDLQVIASKIRNGLNQAQSRHSQIAAEIERLQTEKARAKVTIETYQGALQTLSEGAKAEGIPLDLPPPPSELSGALRSSLSNFRYETPTPPRTPVYEAPRPAKVE